MKMREHVGDPVSHGVDLSSEVSSAQVTLSHSLASRSGCRVLGCVKCVLCQTGPETSLWWRISARGQKGKNYITPETSRCSDQALHV